MPQIDEDQIIAEAFVKVREGVLSQNWNLIVEAYADITGEQLELPEEKPKSRLEKIREKMQLSSSDKDEIQEAEASGGKTLWASMSVKDIKSSLLAKGVTPQELKGLNKEQLVKKAKVVEAAAEPVINQVVQEEQGKMKIISSGIDEEELFINRELAKKKVNIEPVRRKTEDILNDTSSTDKAVRFYNKNTPPRRAD